MISRWTSSIQILRKTVRHTAADTASHPAADRGQFMLNYDAPKRTPVVINQDPASRLISHFYFQLHFKNANFKKQGKRNRGHQCWVHLQSEPFSLFLSHIKQMHYALRRSLTKDACTKTDCFVSLNKCSVSSQACQEHLDGSSHS